MTGSNAFIDDIPFVKELGVEFVSAASGRAVLALALAPRHLNSWAVAHGGVLMTLLDVAMAVAGRSLDPEASVSSRSRWGLSSFLNVSGSIRKLTCRTRFNG